MTKDIYPPGGSHIIDHTVFDQLLEMDDDEERDFSKSIVTHFLEQAEQTFTNIEENLYAYDVLLD